MTIKLPNTENLIDATQNAFIEAAENVAEMIENPDPLPSEKNGVGIIFKAPYGYIYNENSSSEDKRSFEA